MFFIWVVWDPELFGWVVTVKCLVRTHQVVYEKSSKFVSSKPNQSVLYFYVERIVTTLSTVYISALKQTTMIRIIKLDYLRLTRARDDGAVVQDWEEPCHYRISLFRLMGCFKMFDNSMFLHRKWARSLRCLLWISCPSAGWLSLTSGRRSQRWKSTETRNAARKVTAESSLTIRLNSSLLPRTAHTGRGCFPSRCLLVFSNPNKIQLLFNYCSTRYSRK